MASMASSSPSRQTPKPSPKSALISIQATWTSLGPTLLRDPGNHLIEEVIDCRAGVPAHQADPRLGEDHVLHGHGVRTRSNYAATNILPDRHSVESRSPTG